MAKFKKDTPVIHVKSEARGIVISHDGDKVTYLKDDGSTSTVNATSIQTVAKWDGDKAKAAKKLEREAAAKTAKEQRASERKARGPKREAKKDGYVVSGKLEYDPNKYIPRDEVKTATGNKVKDIGDTAADEMAGKSFSEMVAIVARETGQTKAELAAKYEHLNPGMQRMTLGNRLRAALHAKANPKPVKEPRTPKPKVDKPVKETKAPAKKAPAKKAVTKNAKSKAVTNAVDATA